MLSEREDGAVASYSFCPGSEGNGWLEWNVLRGMDGCSAWGALGRDQMGFGQRQGMVTLKSSPDALRDSRYSHCQVWTGEEEHWVCTGDLGMREMSLLWVFLLALMSWEWAETFFFSLCLSHPWRKSEWTVGDDCSSQRSWEELRCRKNRHFFPINAEW